MMQYSNETVIFDFQKHSFSCYQDDICILALSFDQLAKSPELIKQLSAKTQKHLLAFRAAYLKKAD